MPLIFLFRFTFAFAFSLFIRPPAPDTRPPLYVMFIIRWLRLIGFR